MIWKDLGDDDKAIADAVDAIRLDRAYAQAYRVRGNALFGKKEYDKALADYEQAVRLDPNSAPNRYSRGNAWLFKKDFGKALADYQESVRLDPEFPWGHNGIAWVSATCPDPAHRDAKRAVAAATKAVDLTGSNDPVTLGTLAAALAEAGDFDEAVRFEEKSIELLANDKFKADSRARVDLYRAKKPYRITETP
jgi:tetratricopeptide (TPR) repeat protein